MALCNGLLNAWNDSAELRHNMHVRSIPQKAPVGFNGDFARCLFYASGDSANLKDTMYVQSIPHTAPVVVKHLAWAA